MSEIQPVISPHRRTGLSIGVAVGVCVLLGTLAYQALFAFYLERDRHSATQRLDAFALSLEATLSRYESLPGVLALDPSLVALLRDPQNPELIAAANGYLEAASHRANLAAIFLIDVEGTTLATSNWRLPHSFVGHGYGFRPYFQDALRHGIGRFYGVGVTTGEPGYFLAVPVREERQVLGVVVIKVGLESLEQALTNGGDTSLLVDKDGVVFLSSSPALRYRSLTSLPEALESRLRETRQYGSASVSLLADVPIPLEGNRLLRLRLPGEPTQERLIHARPVGQFGWQLVQFGNPGEARAAALGGGAAVGFATAFLIGLVVHMRHRVRRREELRRIHAELETRIAERTVDLTEQIAALEKTKAILRETRDSAVQAGKLAVLGQMSVGMSHELNQPLAALQTFADNASALLARGRHEELAENLQMIRDLVERTGRIVRQLKAFARKEAFTSQPVRVQPGIEYALMIVEPYRREIGAHIAVGAEVGDLQVMAEAGRLEQVLVNLLRNGLDAMAGQVAPLLEISCTQVDSQVIIRVRDHGPGLSEEAWEHLFEPFYTTKPASKGLGLGLAISLTIAESYGGTLTAQAATGGGAEFVLTLPAAGDHHAPSNP